MDTEKKIVLLGNLQWVLPGFLVVLLGVLLLADTLRI